MSFKNYAALERNPPARYRKMLRRLDKNRSAADYWMDLIIEWTDKGAMPQPYNQFERMIFRWAYCHSKPNYK